MRPDLPIEQLLRRKDTRFQVGDRDAYVLAASRDGLHVLARNEESLALPVEA